MRQKMTFIILPVGLNCNLACKYCYHGEASRQFGSFGQMSDEVLKRIFVDACEFQADVDFLWHGGESLLAGLKHFENAVKFRNEAFLANDFLSDGKTRSIVQTNLAAFNQEFCDFFAKEKFILSTSVDGDAKAHNANRVCCDGLGSYEKVLSSIAMWRNKGQKIGAVSLVTDKNVDRVKETYDALKSSGITSFNFHFCAQDEFGSVDGIPENEKTVKFFKVMFDLWLEDDNPDFPVRNFKNVLRFLCGGRPLDCTSNTNGCFGFMAINANGDVYPCHRYVERKEFCIGNILDSSLLEIYKKNENLYTNLCFIHEKCNSCEWLYVCGNGCAHERLTMKGSFFEIDPDCEMKQELFRYIKEKTKDLL